MLPKEVAVVFGVLMDVGVVPIVVEIEIASTGAGHCTQFKEFEDLSINAFRPTPVSAKLIDESSWQDDAPRTAAAGGVLEFPIANGVELPRGVVTMPL